MDRARRDNCHCYRIRFLSSVSLGAGAAVRPIPLVYRLSVCPFVRVSVFLLISFLLFVSVWAWHNCPKMQKKLARPIGWRWSLRPSKNGSRNTRLTLMLQLGVTHPRTGFSLLLWNRLELWLRNALATFPEYGWATMQKMVNFEDVYKSEVEFEMAISISTSQRPTRRTNTKKINT